MKIGIVGDIHWSKYSSIVRSRGEKYSTRLENCIQSVNWAEEWIQDCGCDMTVYLGDFFDKCDLNAEEISALNEIGWNLTPHKFLVGNHEMGINNLSISSAHLFNLCSNIEVISTPTCKCINGVNICFLPFILEDGRRDFADYIEDKDSIVFSHNDLKGIQFGKFVSPIGFEMGSIEQNCKVFFNGHLHNGEQISSKIINVGNLTGQNFSENALEYEHHIMIYDTDTGKTEVYTNPFAFNFLKFDATQNDIYDYMLKLLTMSNISNPVITLKVNQSDKKKYEQLAGCAVASRMIIQPEIKKEVNGANMIETLSVNHLEKFKEYILNELGSSETVVNELSSIIG